IHCSGRNRTEWEWACRSAALSSRATTDDCGLPRICREAQYSNLSCPLLQPEAEYRCLPGPSCGDCARFGRSTRRQKLNLVNEGSEAVAIEHASWQSTGRVPFVRSPVILEIRSIVQHTRWQSWRSQHSSSVLPRQSMAN